MNLNRNPTAEELRALIRNCNDSAGHHVLWVSKGGDVQVTRLDGDQSQVEFEQSHPEMQIRFETFQAGNEYVGQNAAADDEWVSELFESLVAKWRQDKGKPGVVYADAF